jgi:hypothetical protein
MDWNDANQTHLYKVRPRTFYKALVDSSMNHSCVNERMHRRSQKSNFGNLESQQAFVTRQIFFPADLESRTRVNRSAPHRNHNHKNSTRIQPKKNPLLFNQSSKTSSIPFPAEICPCADCLIRIRQDIEGGSVITRHRLYLA